MRYMLFLYEDEDAFDALPPAEQERVIGEHMAYAEALRQSGVFVSGEPLDHSRNGKRIRHRDGRAAVEDGPFTDSKEQIGGFYIVEAEDLDAALDLAARAPTAATGTVEVRPVWAIQ
jgi:hypothetical protein